MSSIIRSCHSYRAVCVYTTQQPYTSHSIIPHHTPWKRVQVSMMTERSPGLHLDIASHRNFGPGAPHQGQVELNASINKPSKWPYVRGRNNTVRTTHVRRRRVSPIRNFCTRNFFFSATVTPLPSLAPPVSCSRVKRDECNGNRAWSLTHYRFGY